MAPRPLTSIFMAPPPPSRLTASGGAPVPGTGPSTPVYNPAFPGLAVTTLPEGGISLLVPTPGEPEPAVEPEPAPVWMPKARQGLGTGAVGKSSVWDVIAGPPGQSSPATNSPISNSRPVSRMPNAQKARSQTGESAEQETMSDSGAAPPRKRHVPRNPLDPHRLALISNALGVSMPLPTRSVLQTKSRDLESRGRQASLDDVRPLNNHYHARNMSLISFRSTGGSPSPNLRGSPSLSVSARRPLASANSQVSAFAFNTPSQPTRFLLHVYPPPHMPSIHPFASRSPPPGYHSQFRRGTLVPLHATLSGQLSAVAKEYGLPSTNGMFVYLLGADFEPPEDDDDDYPAPRDERSMGPRIGEEAWKMLWAALLRADRDEFMRSYNPNEGSAMGSPSSGVTALGEESPPTNAISISPKSSSSSFAPRPLRTVAAMNSREGFKGVVTAASAPGQTPLSVSSPSSGTGTASTALSRNPSLATQSRSNTSSPTTTLSTNPATTVSIMPALPIVGKIEFDIDMRRAPWYAKFCTRAEHLLAQRRLPSRVNTPVGPLATPAPNEDRAPSPITLTLPPRGRSVSPGMDDSGIRSAASSPGIPGSPSGGGKFPRRLQLPSNPLNARGDRGLLSPHDAMMTPTSPGGSSSGWPEDGEEETIGAGGLGLELSPSSSTVADGALEGVVAEGYAPLEEDEEDSTSSSFQAEGGGSMVNGDPLGDVFPDEPWTGGNRGLGIEGLPPTRNEEIDDESGELPPIGAEEEVEEVTNLWNEKNRPSLALSPPGEGEPTAVSRAAAASAQVIFPRPAPTRQRSDSMKRPPPLKLAEAEDNASEQNLPYLSSPTPSQEPVPRLSIGDEAVIVIGEDGQADWTWRSSEHLRKERLDELEKALAQLSPRILEPPPPEFDRPRSPGLHHRMLSNGSARANHARPDPHAPLFMSEELSNLRASMAAKGNTSPTGSASSAQASPSWPAVPFATQAQNSGSIPPSPRFPETPRDPDFLEIPNPNMNIPMSSESRIRMQAEQMRLDLANLPPPETAPPRPRRPQTPVALNSPPMEDSPPMPGHQRSRFSIDSTGDDTIGVPSTRERSNSIMSVKGIRKLWRGRNSTQNLNGKGEMPPPIPSSPNPQSLAFNRDSVLPQGSQSLAPTHQRQQSTSSQAQSAQVSAVKSGAVHKRDSSNSSKDPFRFDQDPKGQPRSTSPSYLSDSLTPGSAAAKEKERATTRGILKKWSSKAKRADGEAEAAPASRPQSRQQNPLSPKKGPLNGLGGPTHSSRGSVSSVNTLTASGLQADMPSRPSVSSSLASDAEPMTPRMSQFEMVSPPQNAS